MIERIGSNPHCEGGSPNSANTANTGIKYEVIRSLIEDEKNPVLLDFSASWCGPCKKLYPILKSLADKYTDIHFYKIDIGNNDKERLGDLYNISSLPTCLFFCNGELLEKQEGFHPGASNIITALANLLVSIENEERTADDCIQEINDYLVEDIQMKKRT